MAIPVLNEEEDTWGATPFWLRAVQRVSNRFNMEEL